MVMVKNRQGNTVERIMVAATTHFAERGFDGARMDTIAKTARVNKATIYYHIGDKKTLYSAVLHRVFSEQADLIAKQMEAASSSQDQLKAVFRGMCQLIEEKTHISAIIMHEIASGGRHFPDELVDDIAQIVGLIHGIIKEGVATNQVAAAHPMLVYLMAVGPMVYYEKIYNNLNKQLVSGSQALGIPIISFKNFAAKLEACVLKALKS